MPSFGQNKLKDKDGAILEARAAASKAQEAVNAAQKKADQAALEKAALETANRNLKKDVELREAQLKEAREKVGHVPSCPQKTVSISESHTV